jgi:hypothetical protein|tara:strand:- start:261 stop:569 length:309 start_codon:yes stop_codon:yes gene_type:complete
MKRFDISSDFLPTTYLVQVGGSFESFKKWIQESGVIEDIELGECRGCCWTISPWILVYTESNDKPLIAHEIYHAVHSTQEYADCKDEEFGAMCTEFLASKLL